MRPPILNPLFQPASALSGIGPRLMKPLTKLVGGRPEARVLDVVFHIPWSMIDRSAMPEIARAPHGAIVTIKALIDRHRPAPPRGRAPYKVYASDETGELELVFFHAREDWLRKAMPVGETRYISGHFEWFNGRPQMVHPDHILTREAFEAMPPVEPVYPMTAGLAAKTMLKANDSALALIPDLPEWQDPAWNDRAAWDDFSTSLKHLHRPQAATDLEPNAPALRRVAFDELLASQLALALTRHHIRRSKGHARRHDGRLVERIRSALPFSLTPSQAGAIAEIRADLDRPDRMLRLLQGDVGSGKTVVALLAMAAAIEAGGQAALMAPTEILARQHLATIAPLAEAAGLKTAILTGRDGQKARRETLAALESGTIDILIGTHALFQGPVEFKNLALAVVDEQHRFGVHQRLKLAEKGNAADILVMTATPIPRTLVLTYFGDMDVSKLLEKPAGRQPVDTRSVSMDRLDTVRDRIGKAIEGGAQVYWVCPLVSESDVLDLSTATSRFEDLQGRFGNAVDLLHGQMPGAKKDEAMARFQAGETRILVTTTVVEVGVDVPNASIMVIEHAERFGLSQLHQLRGRIGRGERQSTCLLVYKPGLGETARARLKAMRETEDGFRIAEMDLKLRGEGEILGTRQSGTPGFRFARLESHADLLEAARDDARLVLARDPDLRSPRGEALRVLLYLFERDEAIQLLKAG